MNDFFDFLKLPFDLKSNLEQFLLHTATRIDFKESTRILSPGQIQNNLYFILEGVVRVYSSIDEYEWTSWFFSKGEFALIPESFIYGKSATEYLETCCPTVVLELSKSDYYVLLEKNSQLNQVSDFIIQNFLEKGKERIFNLSFLPASRRYENFVKEQPYVLSRIQSKHLASFLGTNPESISRFRRDFKKS